MTGRGACHEECLCYFPSREEMNFLWFFRNAARGRRRRRGEARGENTQKERQESRLMMPRWAFFSFDEICCGADESQRGWMRTGSCLKGLEMERASVWRARLSLRTVFAKSKNVLCRHLMFLLESDEELPRARSEHISWCDNFSIMVHVWNLEPMYVGGKKVCKYSEGSISAIMSFSTGKQEGKTAKLQQLLIILLRNISFLMDNDKLVFHLSFFSKLLFPDTLCIKWCWDLSIVNGAGWGCSHQNYKVDYHDNKMCPLGKETMWSMKGRPVPPALIGVVWFGCSSPCSWNRYQMAHEHYNRSNFPNIFNFHRTETDPGVRQQNRALCQLLIPKR